MGFSELSICEIVSSSDTVVTAELKSRDAVDEIVETMVELVSGFSDPSRLVISSSSDAVVAIVE